MKPRETSFLLNDGNSFDDYENRLAIFDATVTRSNSLNIFVRDSWVINFLALGMYSSFLIFKVGIDGVIVIGNISEMYGMHLELQRNLARSGDEVYLLIFLKV